MRDGMRDGMSDGMSDSGGVGTGNFPAIKPEGKGTPGAGADTLDPNSKAKGRTDAGRGAEVVVNPDDVWNAIPRGTQKKLEGMTQKQRDFALMVSHGTDPALAYRHAYAVRKGTKQTSVEANARKLMNNRTVKQALVDIQQGAATAHLLGDGGPPMLTKQWILERLAAEADIRMRNTGAVRVRALELIGRSIGMFEDVQVVKDERPKSSEEAKAKLDEILSRIPDAVVTQGAQEDEEGEEG